MCIQIAREIGEAISGYGVGVVLGNSPDDARASFVDLSEETFFNNIRSLLAEDECVEVILHKAVNRTKPAACIPEIVTAARERAFFGILIQVKELFLPKAGRDKKVLIPLRDIVIAGRKAHECFPSAAAPLSEVRHRTFTLGRKLPHF